MQQGTSTRCLRVAAEIKKALAVILKELDVYAPTLSGVSITVTKVFASPDVRTAKVFLLPLGGRANNNQVLEELNKQKVLLRKAVAREVYLKFNPELIFVYDNSFDTADKINALLDETQIRD